MAVGLANNGTALTRADIYYNDNGSIKTIDDMDVWFKNGNDVYKFPQKDKCILNLDNTSFSLNTIDGASTNILQNFELNQNTNAYSNLGDIVTSIPSAVDGVRINNLEKYWYVNNLYKTNLSFGSNFDMFQNQAITISMTFKFRGTYPTNWRRCLWFFNDNDKFRIEMNPSNNQFGIYGENGFINGNILFPIIDMQTDYVSLAVVFDNRNIYLYQNGSLVTQGTSSRDLASGVNSIYILSDRGNSGSFGCECFIKNFSIWKHALSEQELNDYYKCIL